MTAGGDDGFAPASLASSVALTHPIGLSEPEVPLTAPPPPTSMRAPPDAGTIHRIKANNPTVCCSTGYDFYRCSSTIPRPRACALGIVLTKRGKHQGRDIPCAAPVARRRISAPADRTRPSCLRSASRPRTAEAKRGQVRGRDVVRLVTRHADRTRCSTPSATIIFLPSPEHAVVGRRGKPFRPGLFDISTSEFRIAECDRLRSAEIARLSRANPSPTRCSPIPICALLAHAARRDAIDPRRVRWCFRRAAADVVLAVATNEAFGHAVAARSHRRRGYRHVCRAHPARQAPRSRRLRENPRRGSPSTRRPASRIDPHARRRTAARCSAASTAA